MNNVYVISDLHFGHSNIIKFAGKYRHGENPEENMQSIIDMWNAVIRKRDKVFVLGDVCFKEDLLPKLHLLKGNKILVRGNHDDCMKTEQWLEYFDSVEGITLQLLPFLSSVSGR